MRANPCRVAVFTSSLRGYWMLRYLMSEEVQTEYNFRIVGVATDNPHTRYSNAANRGVWKYGYDDDFEPHLVPRLMEKHGTEVFWGRVKSESFIAQFRDVWQPDLCLMNVFGQILSPALYAFPSLGFFNFHACSGDQWPAYQGPDPFGQMLRNGVRDCQLAFHHVSDVVDGGELYRFTEKIAIPNGATVPDMHLLTAPLAVSLLRAELPKLLNGEQQ